MCKFNLQWKTSMNRFRNVWLRPISIKEEVHFEKKSIPSNYRTATEMKTLKASAIIISLCSNNKKFYFSEIFCSIFLSVLWTLPLKIYLEKECSTYMSHLISSHLIRQRINKICYTLPIKSKYFLHIKIHNRSYICVYMKR